MAAIASASASSVPQTLERSDQAAGTCQPAREYPDLRVRQLEIDNIGSTNAYVVCAINPRLANVGGSNVTMVYLEFFNAGATQAVVRCTLKDQWGVGGPSTTRRKDVFVLPGSQNGFYIEAEADGPFANNLEAAATQCILPPNTSVTRVVSMYRYVLEVVK